LFPGAHPGLFRGLQPTGKVRETGADAASYLRPAPGTNGNPITASWDRVFRMEIPRFGGSLSPLEKLQKPGGSARRGPRDGTGPPPPDFCRAGVPPSVVPARGLPNPFRPPGPGGGTQGPAGWAYPGAGGEGLIGGVMGGDAGARDLNKGITETTEGLAFQRGPIYRPGGFPQGARILAGLPPFGGFTG